MTSDGAFIVRIEHCRALGLCVNGVRSWFTVRELDWRDFLVNGITVDRLREHGDGLSENVIVSTLERENGR